MKRSPMKQRYKLTGPDAATVELVLERDGCCVRCGSSAPLWGMRGVDWSIQHRKKRSAGVDNRPCNLILLCGSGTTGCHGWVEEHPIEAEFEGGWSVSRQAKPADRSVLIRGESGERWVYLGADGRYHDNPEQS